MRRILPYELALNEALPWTVYDEYGNLLLRKGYVIRQQRHLDSLFMRGAYVPEEPPQASIDEIADEVDKQVTSSAPARVPHATEPVFARTRRLANSLERLHADLLAGVMRNDMRMLVIGMAHVIGHACAEDADALISGLHTNRSHSYLVVHQLLGAAVTELVAAQAGIPEEMRSAWVCAALTRDVGMIDIQQQLDTQTIPLDAEQCMVVRHHPSYAEAILEQMGVQDAMWMQVVREHQERCDGSGYPKGLRKDNICEGARLLAVADSYAAMVTPRPNRTAKTPRQAMQTLYLEREAGYDSEWVQRLVKALTLYPPGSMVKLHNGEQALVRTRQGNALDMEVWAVLNADGALLQPPQLRKTAKPDHAIEQPVGLLAALHSEVDVAALWLSDTTAVA